MEGFARGPKAGESRGEKPIGRSCGSRWGVGWGKDDGLFLKNCGFDFEVRLKNFKDRLFDLGIDFI